MNLIKIFHTHLIYNKFYFSLKDDRFFSINTKTQPLLFILKSENDIINNVFNNVIINIANNNYKRGFI